MGSLALATMLASTFQFQRLDAAAAEPSEQPCINPTPLSADAPSILLIGDSISMGAYGYCLFVQSMLQTKTGGTFCFFGFFLAWWLGACSTAVASGKPVRCPAMRTEKAR